MIHEKGKYISEVTVSVNKTSAINFIGKTKVACKRWNKLTTVKPV